MYHPDGAVLVDRPPEVVQLAPDPDEDLVQVPLVARPGSAPLERGGEGVTKPPAPGADALVADHDAALGQNRLDLAQAQAEAVPEPHRMADDLGREAETAVRVGRPHAHTLPRPSSPRQPDNIAVCALPSASVQRHLTKTRVISSDCAFLTGSLTICLLIVDA